MQCQIDIETGRKLTPSVCLWQATGGRFLEAPHLYRIGSYYYLLAAEGGTEYGHMCVYARSREMLGPYESYPRNPVLTNRDLGGYSLQGVGHGDLIRDGGGNYWMVHLAFRQLDNWVQHHITGREVCLVPVVFHEDGWFTAGENGTTRAEVETALIGGRQEFWKEYTFRNTEAGREWCFLRNPDLSQYAFSGDGFTLRGGSAGLSGSAPFPTFVGMRQKEMRMTVRCAVASEAEEACLCMYMQEDQHYEIGLRKEGHGYCLFRRLRVGDCEVVDRVIPIRGNTARLKIRADNLNYHFSAAVGGTEYPLGEARTKFLSTELAGNFTGVFTGLFAKNGDARFTDFSCVNEETYP